MFSSFRLIRLAVLALTASMSIGCSLFSHTSGAPPDANPATQIHAHPLLHEALVSSSPVRPGHPLDILYPPPSPLPEPPSGDKPTEDDVVWAPGYWIWDTTEDNWHWIRGVWVHAPPGRRWVPGYWSVVADGWRWVPGHWVIDPPSPPPSPMPAYAYPPSGSYYGNPDLVFLAGYGMWWPGYWYWPNHHAQHQGTFMPPAVSPGSHRVEPITVPLPALASNIHGAPPIQPHLDMASVLASVPKPLASTFDPHLSSELHTAHPLFALHAGSPLHSEHVSSLFSSAAHMGPALHEHLVSHVDLGTHSSGSEKGHASSSHTSGGHGGSGHGK